MAIEPAEVLAVETQRQILADMWLRWLTTRVRTEVDLKIQARLKARLGRATEEAEHTLVERLRDADVAAEALAEEVVELERAAELPARGEVVVSQELRRQIMRDMRQLWVNTRFQTEAELRIQGRLKAHLKRDTAEAERGLLERLRDCEVAIQLLDEEIAGLTIIAA